MPRAFFFVIILDPNAKDFSLVNALACAQASELAYNPPLIGATRIDSALAHVLVIEGDARLVAFRGTACMADFITDAKYCRKKIGSGFEVHEGFEEGVVSIESQLNQLLSGLPEKPLYFAGHSYGGACAVRFADLWEQRCTLQKRPDNIAGVYTAGQPRLYNRPAAASYDLRLGPRTFRLVFQEDIVARMPLFPPPAICHLHVPYWHCGQEIFLPNGGGYIPSPTLLQLGLSDFIGLYRAYRLRGIIGAIDDPLADHAVAKNYVAALTALRPTPSLEAALS